MHRRIGEFIGRIIRKEWFKEITILVIIIFIVWGGIASAKLISEKLDSSLAIKREIAVPPGVQAQKQEVQEQPATAPAKEALPEKIVKQVPKSTAGKITGSTKSNSDGSKTTTVSEGSASAADFAKVAQSGPSGSTPYTITFSDETGAHADLEKALKDYINNQLRWSTEISSLYQIIIRDAGDSGWTGQYNGTYSTMPNGTITSAFGYIVLNTYYFNGKSNLNDLMKWTLSHEYGHHYSLYHRWVDLNIPAGQRFPDEYYSMRPLSKETTAVDYSKDWQNCDSEIVAEDYSYFYSGYGIQQMHEAYGLPLPSVATKTWLYNLGKPTVDNSPTITILQPAVPTLVGTVAFTASATDDRGISKVDFYIDSALISEDDTAPYESSILTGNFTNGEHTIKVVAYDTASQTSEKTMPVTINNTITISFLNPTTDPYSWESGDLLLQAKADTGDVVKMEFWLNGGLALPSMPSNEINATWPYRQGSKGMYTLIARAYDKDGNFVERSMVINKK